MLISPKAELYLLENIPLNSDYQHTIDFESIEAQQKYFRGKISSILEENEDYSFIRQNESIVIDKNIEELLNINYLMYCNNEKWYYCFITSKKYKSEDRTELFIKTDVMQTYMFDYSLEECFIEREHQDRFNKDLTPKINEVVEDIDYGQNYKLDKVERVIDNRNTTTKKRNIKWAILICSDKLTDDSVTNTSTLDNYYYYAVPFESPSITAFPPYFYFQPSASEANYIQLQTAAVVCKLLASKYSTKIVSIKLYETPPFTCYYRDYGENDVCIRGSDMLKVITLDNSKFFNIKLSIEKVFNGDDSLRSIATIKIQHKTPNIDINSSPKIENETKLLNDPYYFIQLTNHNGEGLKIKLPGLRDITQIPIYCIPVCSPDSKIMYYVKGYYGDDEGRFYNYIDNTINEIPLTTDKWQEYLTMNKASATTGIAVNLATSAATTALGAFTGNPFAIAGGVLSLGQNISNTLIKREDIKQQPNSIKSQGNNASFTLVRGLNSLELEYYSIVDSAKQRMFNYFLHYGYRCNEFKKPNLKSRYYFNYIKTLGANILSNIDNDFKDEIKQIFNNGVTIWHYRDETTFKGVENYNYENVEINLMEE